MEKDKREGRREEEFVNLSFNIVSQQNYYVLYIETTKKPQVLHHYKLSLLCFGAGVPWGAGVEAVGGTAYQAL